MEEKVIEGDEIKGLRTQDIGWITHMDVEVINNNRSRVKNTESQVSSHK